jgi:hypothetical protein
MRLLYKFVCGACLTASLALAFFWVRNFYVLDDLHYLTANPTTLTIRDWSFDVSRDRMNFEVCSTTYDEMGGLNWALERKIAEGHPLGLSHVREQPFHLSSDRWYSPYVLFNSGWSYPAKPLLRLHRDTGVFEILGNYSVRGSTMAFPIWEPLLLFLVPPLIALAVYVRRRRRLRHALVSRRCVKCNYDLRASKGRCPECGTAF